VLTYPKFEPNPRFEPNPNSEPDPRSEPDPKPELNPESKPRHDPGWAKLYGTIRL